jgi:hypothetical protein
MRTNVRTHRHDELSSRFSQFLRTRPNMNFYAAPQFKRTLETVHHYPSITPALRYIKTIGLSNRYHDPRIWNKKPLLWIRSRGPPGAIESIPRPPRIHKPSHKLLNLQPSLSSPSNPRRFQPVVWWVKCEITLNGSWVRNIFCQYIFSQKAEPKKENCLTGRDTYFFSHQGILVIRKVSNH